MSFRAETNKNAGAKRNYEPIREIMKNWHTDIYRAFHLDRKEYMVKWTSLNFPKSCPQSGTHSNSQLIQKNLNDSLHPITQSFFKARYQ